VLAAVGAGFTGRFTLGLGPVPLVVSCRGPKAQKLAREIGDGAMTGIFYPGGLGRVRERRSGPICL
jgi:alkanesulfonate monooxygenase SsuD/methylene tetrahydromethanopterin reductase-like flavin-dependent oxidoreductase (luciferase family)